MSSSFESQKKSSLCLYFTNFKIQVALSYIFMWSNKILFHVVSPLDCVFMHLGPFFL